MTGDQAEPPICEVRSVLNTYDLGNYEQRQMCSTLRTILSHLRYMILSSLQSVVSQTANDCQTNPAERLAGCLRLSHALPDFLLQ
jgi:hypothetical protein